MNKYPILDRIKSACRVLFGKKVLIVTYERDDGDKIEGFSFRWFASNHRTMLDCVKAVAESIEVDMDAEMALDKLFNQDEEDPQND